MRKVEHRLRLDLLRGGNQGYIRVKRGENGARRLAIALYMHSVPYMADAGTTAVFRAIKPDNTKLFNSATITDNVVTVGLTTQTVATLGTVRCELSIYGTNNELLYSPQFDVIVEDYLYSDTAMESTDEYSELTEAISKVNGIVSTEAARVAAENQRVANETARVSAEAERASAETARAEAETARATAETDRASAESARVSNENIRKQAEKQRVSSETQRDTAETARSTAESGRRSAETARVQEFNAIKADAQDAATAEATRATNEAARVAAEANRANAEQLRVALYNLWNNATASAYGSLSPSVTLSNKDGHKHFNFGIPLNSRERDEIEVGELESTALNFTGFTFYNIWEPDLEWDANISSYGLPSGINKSFVLITGPAEITESGNIDRSWDVPQTIFDGQNIYMRRLGVSHTGSGSEDDPIVVSYYNKEWESGGGGGLADVVKYTSQSLSAAQKAQARTNIGAVSNGDINDKLPIYIKMISAEDNSNEVIAEDGTVGYQILEYLDSGREVVLIYHGFTYYLSEQDRDGATPTSLSFAACAKNSNGVNVLSRITYDFNKTNFTVTTEGRYIDPIDGIIKSDLAEDVQTSLAKADAAISLGITAATVGQTIRVKAVDDAGKPIEWEAVDQRYTLTVTVNTQDGVTVTGQTVTVRAGDADGAVFGTAAYNGQAVSFDVPDGFAYYVEVTDDLAAHFKPSTAKGVINGASASVTLLYNDFSTIKTAPDIKAALDADMDLTELVGQQITCQRSGVTLAWDVVDYNATDKVVTLLMHDLLPDTMQFEPSQALAYFPDGLAAGAYSFASGNNTYYFTLAKAIPAGGQLRATETTFNTYASQTAVAVTENGAVSTTTIDGATSLGKSGEGTLNHMDRVKYGSNNFGESGLRQWLNSSAAAGETMPQITKFQRPYAPNRPGFMAGLDADFVASVADTTWPCSANTTYECPADMGGITAKGASYTVTSKFALASEKELFGSYAGVQAGDTVFDLYQDADNTDRIKYYNNTARNWRMRSPYRIGAHLVRNVVTTGAGGNYGAYTSDGVAVACKIAKSN